MAKPRSSKGPDPPQPEEIDLSPRAIQHAVMKTATDNIKTVGPLGIAAAAGVWMLAFGPAAWAIFGLGVGIVAGLANFGLNFFLWGDDHASHYIQQMNGMLEAERWAKVKALQESLVECGNRVKGVDELVEQATAQCGQVLERIGRVRDVLAEKLSASELAYGRFAGTAEQLSLAILDNLARVEHLLLALPRDHETTKRRLAELGRPKKLTEGQEQARAAFAARKEIYDKQLERVGALLAQNETALTNLDSAVVTLAELDTKRGEADMDLKSARSALEDITRRLKAFSVSQAAEGKDSVL